MKKILLSLLLIILLVGTIYALNVKTIYNPFTGELDYILNDQNMSNLTFVDNLNMGTYDIYNATNFNSTNIHTTNLYSTNLEKNLDGTGYNITASWFKGSLNWSDIQNKFITAVDNIYIYMSGTTATFNETKLNATGDARYVNIDGDTMTDNLNMSGNNVTNIGSAIADFFYGVYDWVVGLTSSDYLNFNGTQLDFNETKLNDTIGIIGNTTYILQSDEANLNVNSSDYWDSLDTPSDINAADITDDGTYVKIIGDTMTGNLTFEGNNTGLCYGPACEGNIYWNGTSLIIKVS